MIARPHLLQPFTRAAGHLRGLRSPPTAAWHRPRAAFVAGCGPYGVLWARHHRVTVLAEQWIGAEALLTRLTDGFAGPLTCTLEIEEGG